MKHIATFTLLILPLFLLSQSLYFPPLTGDEWESVSPADLNWCEDKIDDLDLLLEDGGTKAFIVLKDGKIVIEKYFGDFTRDDSHVWNSAGKTITSFLIGIAQQEGHLSLTDKTSDYLGQGWTSLPEEKEDLILIKNQLSMTSGLDDSRNGFCTDPGCLNYISDAGQRWAYHNGPYTLLGEVIQSATGSSINNYLFRKVQLQTGMGGSFFPIGFNNIFISKPRNMARFGLLILNKGKWKNTEILKNQNYFSEMTSRSQELNKGYGYLWWLNNTNSYKLPGSQIEFPGNPTPNAPLEMYSGIGKDGQFLDIIPSQNLVVIRMGEAPDNDLVPLFFHNEMWSLLSQIICNPTSVKEGYQKPDLLIHPNPFTSTIKLSDKAKSIRVYDAAAKPVFHKKNTQIIELDFLPPGFYTLKTEDSEGKLSISKILKL